MKHHICVALFFVSSMVCAEVDKRTGIDKTARIGRFSSEDCFDINQAGKIVKQWSVAIKKNVQRFLCPSDEDPIPQRLLLLGGIRNTDTTTIAKMIALRWKYDYYVIEAYAFLQACREGREDNLLSEVRSIIRQGKPIALITTEIAEMEDYFGLYAFTLRIMIDQCADYPNVMVIGTSAFREEQLSELVKQRFTDIISIDGNRAQDAALQKMNWLEKNKTACMIAAGFVCCALGTIYVGTYILSATMQLQQQHENSLLNQQVTDLLSELHSIKEKYQLFQKQQSDIQQKLNRL